MAAMAHQEILHRCFRCGYCKLPSGYEDLNCPSYLQSRFESYSPGGRMWLLRGWLDGQLGTTHHLAEILFACATCGNCVTHCAFPRFRDDILNAFLAAREAFVDEGVVPPTVASYLKAMAGVGNPYRADPAERGRWADGLDLPPFDGQPWLLLVGDEGAYDDRGRQMARAVARLLSAWDVPFGVLGAAERTDGNEVRVLGETALFDQLARENLADWRERGVQQIITLSPHAHHALRNDYPALGEETPGDDNVVPAAHHYSQVLARRVREVSLPRAESRLKVTFHDPCYLGRRGGEYRAPRRFLQALPGVSLVEMRRSERDALCCGGGGGNVFTDVLGSGPDSPARVRVREAAATGADVLAVACPSCARMLGDALLAEDLQDTLRVLDLAEIAWQQLPAG